jgi:hypothetical protein
MSNWDAFGYLAAGLVFMAFGMKEMVSLRIVAIFSNLAFVVYGLGLHLTPVWLLHGFLLPLNGWRLAQALQSASGATLLTSSPLFLRWTKIPDQRRARSSSSTEM